MQQNRNVRKEEGLSYCVLIGRNQTNGRDQKELDVANNEARKERGNSKRKKEQFLHNQNTIHALVGLFHFVTRLLRRSSF
jgi:hypothetical protein